MRISNINALLTIGVSCGSVGSSSTASTPGRCRAFCKEIRQGVLDDVSTCLPAFNLPPVPKLYHACFDGRKKAFDRACAPLCAQAEMTVTSFDGCQTIKKHGRQSVDWCRKGYDSILQNPEIFFIEHSKEEEKQELVKEHESMRSNSDPVKSDLVSKPVSIESVQSESEPEVESNDSEFEQIKTVQSEPVVKTDSVQSHPVHRNPEVEESDRAISNENLGNKAGGNDHVYVEESEPVKTDSVQSDPVHSHSEVEESHSASANGNLGNKAGGNDNVYVEDTQGDPDDAPGNGEEYKKLTLRGMKEREL